ncbi:MAG TPA: competence/damage-inducible protein A [Cytophaga sp.]|jgi:nicotinamide-nucleotide amidase|nr:competence/damage-inducible protein A [Cytophaga sp.]
MNTQIYADIITIGDEILYGQITDTNSQWISAELDKIGIKTRQKSSVSDHAGEILRILDESGKRSSLVIITGGLGPTNDDITKKTLCTFFNTELVWSDEVLNHLQSLFFIRGRQLSELNKQQALIPANCEVLTNNNGTAPGMWIDVNNVVYISLPGVPFEMKSILSECGFQKIKNRFQTPVIVHRMIKTSGIGESLLSEIIAQWENALPKHISLAYLPSVAEVKLRLTAVGENEQQLKKDVQNEIDAVLPLIHTHVYGFDDETLQKFIGDLLKSKNKTIATAESCTGGYLAHLLTSVPGASSFYYGSIVAYQNAIKTQFLNVPSEILQQHGAVSEKTVEIMAKEIRLKLGTSIGVAASGIAGPDGGTDEKPVGTIWIAYADEEKVVTKKLQLSTLRENNIRMTALAILNLIRQQLKA